MSLAWVLGAVLACGAGLYLWMRKRLEREMSRSEAEEQRLLDETKSSSEAMLGEARLKAEVRGAKARADHERHIREERLELQPTERRPLARARDGTRRIEGEITYPSQSQVRVIRELRASELAR